MFGQQFLLPPTYFQSWLSGKLYHVSAPTWPLCFLQVDSITSVLKGAVVARAFEQTKCFTPGRGLQGKTPGLWCALDSPLASFITSRYTVHRVVTPREHEMWTLFFQYQKYRFFLFHFPRKISHSPTAAVYGFPERNVCFWWCSSASWALLGCTVGLREER